MKIQAMCLLFALAGCSGGDDELDEDNVTNLPPGDATGSGTTGSYRMESLTTGCSGDCTTSFDGGIYSACDVGTRLDDIVDVTQTNGALVIDIDNSDYVSRMTGGIFADGTFDVGGVRTQLGGAVTITARSQGTFAGDSMTGNARLRVSGSGLACYIEVELTGARR